MLPDDWLYSFWEKKVVDCASIKLVVSIFMHCFHVGYHHHDIPGTLCQFIWEISFIGLQNQCGCCRGCQTVLALRHFTVGCFFAVHTLLEVRHVTCDLPFGEFDSKSMFPPFSRLESIHGHPYSSFKMVYLVGSDLKFSSSAHGWWAISVGRWQQGTKLYHQLAIG